MKKSGSQISLPSKIIHTIFTMTELPRCILKSISLQTIFERLSDLARELLAICFIEDTLS
jgi:hypothetical protein